MDAMQKEIRKLEKRLTVLFEAWEDGTITNNEFVERKAANNDKIESIKFQMQTLEESIPNKEEYKEKVFKLTQALESLTDDSISAEIKNEYLKSLIERIYFSRENDEEFILDVILR
jgi:DNA repair ATPase RecN